MYNLQEDLEMSESDDDNAPEVKNPPVEYLKSPVSNAMDAPPALSARSSSSESCESDSDETSSESNDSDSSPSSEASDVETPSKQPAPQMWGLSNFFDETRRNHSPAFMPLDTNTNSSTAVKEEPLHSVGTERDSFSLADEDSVNGILEKYSDPDIKEYLRSPMNELLDLEVAPVDIKTEILSPIPSPICSAPLPPPAPPIIRGPRTPPTPPTPVKEDPEEDEEEEEEEEEQEFHHRVSIKSKSPKNLQQFTQSKPKVRSEVREEMGKVQNERVKKRVCKNKNENSSPRVKASPVPSSSADEVFSASKGPSDTLVKQKDAMVAVASCPVPSEPLESSRETSVKSRHKHSISSSTKKVKSHGETNESAEKRNSSLKTTHVSKGKHSTKQVSRSSSDTRKSDKLKPDGNQDSSKRSKLDRKEKRTGSSLERIKDSQAPKSSGHNKNTSKNSSKLKSKSSKLSPKQSSEVKKPEGKKKKKKFSIKNFVQSPVLAQKESERLSDVLPYFSPSPERSPIPEVKRDIVESRRKPSISPSHASRSPPSRSSSKSVERVKNLEKRGRTPRSEHSSSVAPSESSIHQRENSEGSRKGQVGSASNKSSSKSRERIDGLPIHVEPPQLLSPIPQNSPIPNSESAIPAKIMVSIPLEKLFRLPMQAPDCKLPKGSRSSVRSDEITALSQKKSSASQEKISKHDVSDKRSQSKDKSRTDPSKSRTSKNVSVKKSKSSKPPSEPSESKSKTSSTVNSKSSIKIVVDKTHCDESENQIPKKRKNEEEDKQHAKKKPKVSSHPVEERKTKEQSPVVKKDMMTNQTDSIGKLKPLERCDSASSLSSLCSQQSQRSSKSSKEKLKDSLKNAPETKKIKTSTSPLLTSKEIKQEKEEKSKIYIKKEPGIVSNIEKCKLKTREKLAPKDIECKEKKVHEMLWNDNMNSSSQYCPWEEPCKAEDPKGQLLTNQSLVDSNRDSGSDWDHFAPEMHKELKEASNLNKHNNQTPIMPMDYFWTEGKKQKHLAEKEKDPLLQVLKYFEATVLFILTSQQREEYTKDPDSVYQFYKETLKFSAVIRSSVQKLQSQYHNTNTGSTEFKLLILCLKCQSLLHVKLYNLKIKEIKEQQKGVSDFFRTHCPNALSGARNPSQPSPCQPRIGGIGGVPSPHSPTPSPAGSVNSVGSQSSGYSSSEINGNHTRNLLQAHSANVQQYMLDMICRQHTHLINLHLGHDLWEQADMYMTRSNLREFFKEVADQSEPLTLHSTIKELVSYIQKGLSLVKKCSR